MSGTLAAAASIFLVCCVLAVLEISLSFDNAIVNANKLKTMRPLWQRRFLTWGIVIAVVGMRVVFPVLIVVIAAQMSPLRAVVLAASQPEDYAAIMREAHLPVAAFGGTFLMMVALSFFFDHEQEDRWVLARESWAARYASMQGISIAVVPGVALSGAALLEDAEASVFVTSAVWGLFIYLAVDLLGGLLDSQAQAAAGAARGGLGAFLYLEMLDASFSFDGVIGAFALMQNLFIIGVAFVSPLRWNRRIAEEPPS